MDKRISIQICSKDRHTELFGCLQSLRTQTVQNWDLIILDESQTPIQNSYFLTYIINRLKLEGHKIKLIRQSPSYGVCYARNKLIKEDTFNNFYTCRLDDDILLEQNYLEKLLQVIDKGYDMASGVVPHIATPEFKRENKYIQPIINEHRLDGEGNLIKNEDSCGYCYLEEEILPTSHFRTNLLYPSKVHKEIEYLYPRFLSTVGFREEGFASFKLILADYTIGIHTGAKAYHLICPSGGVRRQDYAQCTQIDDESFRKWIKEKFQKHGNFLETYHNKLKERGLLK